MWLKRASKKREHIVCVLFGVYISAVLWITLFSRIGTETRAFLFPFHSYSEIIKGNWNSLIENIGNVVLFIPFGIGLTTIKKNNFIKVVTIGATASLFIEVTQGLFSLGTVEIDDLLHNTLGTVLGFYLTRRKEFHITIKNKHVLIIVTMLISLWIPFGCQKMQFLHMSQIATNYDREDGSKNLLVMNGKNGYVWNTDVYVRNLDDGRIRISGKSDIISWWPIANITLTPGFYTFKGLSCVEEKTVGLELEVDNHRFAPDVGPVQSINFKIDEKTKLKVYVIVYPGCDCDVIATPVIYKEE